MKRSFIRSQTFLYLASFTIMMVGWCYATWHLYSLPEHSTSAFQAITTQAMWGIIGLAGAIAGVKGWMDHMSMKVDIANTASTVAQIISNKTKIETIEHVIDEGSVGSPGRRPFNPDDSHEEGIL